MINLDFDGAIDESQIKGFYFRPISHICKHFLVEVIKKDEWNCLVVIYEIGIPQRDGKEMIIANGEEIATYETTDFLEIDLWGKYYFPKFNEERYQWYYNMSYNENKEWVFDKDGNMDDVLAMAEVMKFAINLGVKISGITLY